MEKIEGIFAVINCKGVGGICRIRFDPDIFLFENNSYTIIKKNDGLPEI
jgi:hypothetical protein